MSDHSIHDRPFRDEGSPLTRRDRRKMETREKLFEAAMTLLCERGFDEMTVEMITEATDVGKGTFFNYFRNKEEVVAYYFESICDLLKEQLQVRGEEPMEASSDLLPHPIPVGGPIWRQVATAGYLVAAQDGRNRRLTRTLLALALTNDKVREAHLRVKDEVHNVAIDLIRRGQETGEFRNDLPPHCLGEFIRGAYLSALYSWAQSEEEFRLEEIMMRNIVMAWYAVRNQDVAAEPLPVHIRRIEPVTPEDELKQEGEKDAKERA